MLHVRRTIQKLLLNKQNITKQAEYRQTFSFSSCSHFPSSNKSAIGNSVYSVTLTANRVRKLRQSYAGTLLQMYKQKLKCTITINMKTSFYYLGNKSYFLYLKIQFTLPDQLTKTVHTFNSKSVCMNMICRYLRDLPSHNITCHIICN